jgi:hypothetical protein
MWVKSRPFEVKEDRPAIAAEVRRAMWAGFYTDNRSSEHQRNGCMLAQACIGCKARRVTPTQLSPLLDNVHAAHIIADAKGGPHGDDKKEVWNFFPLCKGCSLDMKTTNAIDWLYLKRGGPDDSLTNNRSLKCCSGCGGPATGPTMRQVACRRTSAQTATRM